MSRWRVERYVMTTKRSLKGERGFPYRDSVVVPPGTYDCLLEWSQGKAHGCATDHPPDSFIVVHPVLGRVIMLAPKPSATIAYRYVNKCAANSAQHKSDHGYFAKFNRGVGSTLLQ